MIMLGHELKGEYNLQGMSRNAFPFAVLTANYCFIHMCSNFSVNIIKQKKSSAHYYFVHDKKSIFGILY